MSIENGDWLSTRHESVFAYIQNEIAEGSLAAGVKLPGERILAGDLGLSRETVRLGLRMAEQAGLIVRIPTRGSFVAPPRVDQDLGRMDTFESTVRHLHMSPSYHTVSVQQVSADKDQGDRLRVPPGAPLLSVDVLGVASGLPLAYYSSVLPPHVVDQLPEGAEWGASATYQVAGRALGLTELDVEQEFEAISISKTMAQRLRVSAKSSGFRVVSLFTNHGTPIELRTAWYPGSRYRFRASRSVDLL